MRAKTGRRQPDASREQPPRPARSPQAAPAGAKPRSQPPDARQRQPWRARRRRSAASVAPSAMTTCVPSPPSTLDLDRSASSARSGRRELKERFDEHTETGPALTGGDVDADWESAYSVGDEAPGGDNPTPDQDIVDDIGRAVGVEYQDNEELKGDEKICQARPPSLGAGSGVVGRL